MTTKNLVPRATGEGTVGTLAKPWLAGVFNTIYASGIRPLTDGVSALQIQNVAGTPIVTIDTANLRVGIGRTPSYSLDVYAPAGIIGLSSSTGANPVYHILINTGGYMQLGIESSAGGEILTGSSAYAGVLNVNSSYPLQFGTNNILRMTIASSGNVGIGTANAVSRLDMGDPTSGYAISWGGTAGVFWGASIGARYSTGDLFLGKGLRLNTVANTILYSYATYPRAGMLLGNNNGDILFFNEASATKTLGDVFDFAANTRMIIKENGNVGIGMSPVRRLDITGVNGEIGLTSSTGTNSTFINLNNTAGPLYIGRDQSAGAGLLTGSSAYAVVINGYGAYPMQFGTNNVLRMTIDATGNVGINMTPSYRLDITGNFRCSTGFGCNGATPQTAYASGGALAGYATGTYGYDTAAHASALYAMVVAIRAALVANGTMS